LRGNSAVQHDAASLSFPRFFSRHHPLHPDRHDRCGLLHDVVRLAADRQIDVVVRGAGGERLRQQNLLDVDDRPGQPCTLGSVGPAYVRGQQSQYSSSKRSPSFARIASLRAVVEDARSVVATDGNAMELRLQLGVAPQISGATRDALLRVACWLRATHGDSIQTSASSVGGRMPSACRRTAVRRARTPCPAARRGGVR